MKFVFTAVIFLIGTILTVAALLSKNAGNMSNVWIIAGWSIFLLVLNMIAPGILLKRAGTRNRLMGAVPAAAVVVGFGSFLSLTVMAATLLVLDQDLSSTSNLIAQTVIMGLTLSTASFCFVAATGAEIKSGALNTEDRERLLSGLSRLLRHVQSQRPEAVDKVRELDSNIRHKAPHPSRIEQASKYKSIIEFANDDQTFQLDGTQLSSKLDQMLEASRNLS